MGLHESFAQVRGQLLLMDPLPPINKVFALISQEEQQRKIGVQSISNTDSASTLAFAVKNDYSNKFADNTGTYKSGIQNPGGSRFNNSGACKG